MKQIRDFWTQLNKKKVAKYIAAFITVCVACYFLYCEILARQAGTIFTKAMARQKVLIGTVSAEKVRANLWGNVMFDNLRWDNPKGETMVHIPHARIQVRPWELIWHNPHLNCIAEIELEDAEIYLAFDKNMQLDVLQKKDHEQKKQNPTEKKNVHLPKQLPNIKLILKNVDLGATYENRQFILHDFNGQAQIRNHNELEIHMAAGEFGGSMVGDGFNIDGKVMQLNKDATLSMNIGLYNVVPSSLGLRGVDDPMTLTGEVKGALKSPLIDGSVSMKKLNIPGLAFTKVTGNYHYADGLISLQDVTGSIYGGTLEAYGLYHFDNHHYSIDLKAKNLMADAAAKNQAIKCKVNLDVTFRQQGRDGNDLVFGTFQTGKGSAMLVPFKQISGSFSNQNKELAFTDVTIRTEFGDVRSNAFRIVNGKVILSDIFFVETDGRRTKLH